tara:strand:- start:661 stop:1404 length:744 start_codon:yes stop_codon:yes gene_type:complete
MEIDLENSEVTCFFIGNAHDFSEAAISLATISFSSVLFRRLTSIDDLLALKLSRPDRVRSIILNQSMAQSMIVSMGAIQERFPNAIVAFAYRQPHVARQLLTEMQSSLPKVGVAFLPMNRDVDRWLTILHLLVYGENYIPSELFFAQATGHSDKAPEAENAVSDTAPKCTKSSNSGLIQARLTHREAEVLSCVAEGKQNKLIADRLGLSEHTVKLHIHHVIAKLGVNNRTEAAVWFLEHQKPDHLVQ